MNALAANERWTVSRRLPGPLESMQRDAIVQSLLGLPRQQGQDSRITRGVPCHDLPQDPPVRDHHPGQLTGHATPYRLNLRTASCHRRRRVTCRPSPLPRPVRQRSKLPGPGLAPGGEPPGLGTGDRRALPARGPPHTRLPDGQPRTEPAPTGIDYLAALGDGHDAALRDQVSYRFLVNGPAGEPGNRGEPEDGEGSEAGGRG